MKPEELFIGAWVYNAHHEKNIQITPYDFFTHQHDENGVQRLKRNSIPRAGKDLYPIPLTPEILKKNGFEIKPFYAELQVVEGTSKFWVRCDTRQLAIKRNDGFTSLEIPCHSVHKLQAALRLFGIEKEVVL